MSNHYHFIARGEEGARDLSEMLSRLHTVSASALNQLDRRQGRRVWFNFWDSRLTYQRSYFARLKYAHQNPVKHGLVADAREYRWCSASWFERTAPRSAVETINSFQIDRLKVNDDFD
ncbi:MAG: transposase [Blastocatellia bacterium]